MYWVLSYNSFPKAGAYDLNSRFAQVTRCVSPQELKIQLWSSGWQGWRAAEGWVVGGFSGASRFPSPIDTSRPAQPSPLESVKEGMNSGNAEWFPARFGVDRDRPHSLRGGPEEGSLSRTSRETELTICGLKPQLTAPPGTLLLHAWTLDKVINRLGKC